MPELSPARATLAELETQAVKTKLRVVPEQLRAARQEETAARAAFEDAKTAAALVEAVLVREIAEAKDDGGKPKYSNTETRAAALERLKAGREEYHKAAASLRHAQAALDTAVNRRAALADELAAARALARLLAAEIALIANDD